ncbi:MAG: menaquinone-dependent protoporphyrinogen IX dehydrogenase [Vibrio sp.]
MRALLLYSSQEGQTRKIIQRIAAQMPEYTCEVQDLHQSIDIDWAEYDKVLIGASIRYGRLNPALYRFIEHNLVGLTSRKVAFFCVNLTARKEQQGKDTPQGSAYIQTFLKKSAWQPERIAVFAGALYYPRYRWFDKMIIRLIMTLTGGETDTSQEVEYTNWDKVVKFAQQFRNW